MMNTSLDVLSQETSVDVLVLLRSQLREGAVSSRESFGLLRDRVLRDSRPYRER
jgi:hypothetical protein